MEVWLKYPEKLNFRHQLVGFETDWIYSNDAKIITYNNLSSGSYTFVVQSKNEEDVWSVAETYEFVILTPIWQHWWFWLIIITVVAICVYLF